MGINRYVLLLVISIALGLATRDVSTASQFDQGARRAIAPEGRLRVGVYPGSPTSMIRDQPNMNGDPAKWDNDWSYIAVKSTISF